MAEARERGYGGPDHPSAQLVCRMRRVHRSLAVVSVLVLSLTTLMAAPTTAADPTSAELRAAAAHVEALINARRERRDKRPFRLDARVAALAQAKSQDMIDRDYFGHVDTKGRVARDHLRRADIRFTRVGEIIAWNRGGDLMEAAEGAVAMWLDSAVHKRQIMTDNNYFGAGVATDGRTWKWTVIFITGPDRTKPTARFTGSPIVDGKFRLAWTGSDPKLVVGTAGIKSFDLDGRVPGGAWTRIRTKTIARAISRGVPAGATREFRVRARDKAGNIGAWSAIREVTAP